MQWTMNQTRVITTNAFFFTFFIFIVSSQWTFQSFCFSFSPRYTDEGYDGDKKTFVRRLSTLQETGAKFETRKKEHLARDGEVAKTKATIMKYVKSVFVVHVGGTRCVPSSTDNIMKIRARITLTVECIRACVCLFLCYV